MLHSILTHIRFFGHYVVANLLGALEYRLSFFSQVIGMLINDAMWVTFWWIYFSRFNVLQGGWRLEDVLGIWCIVAVGFALSAGLFGNSLRIAEIVSQGKLDYYLALPKNVLLHVLISYMDITAWGDMIFGWVLFVAFLHPSPERLALFLLLALCSAMVFTAANIFWQSTAFWLGNSEGLAFQMWNALVTFSTYPSPLFRGLVKGLLFSAVPAAFVSWVPVDLLRSFDPVWLLAEVGAAVGSLSLAVFVFYRGLRRYESGNLMTART